MRVYIAGHKGMVGKSLLNHLKKDNDIELVYSPRKNLDLIDATSVNKFFKNNNIDQVYLAAAKVGGINANNIFPAEFIYENLMIQTNVIHASHQNDINNLLFSISISGSSVSSMNIGTTMVPFFFTSLSLVFLIALPTA